MRFFGYVPLVLVLFGCDRASGPTGAAGAPVTAIEPTHAALFAAADRGDIAEFKGLLTPESVQLLDRYFAATATLDRKTGSEPHGWPDLVAEHRDLSAAARVRNPYPVVADGARRRLNLAGRPESKFFREVVSAMEPKP